MRKLFVLFAILVGFAIPVSARGHRSYEHYGCRGYRGNISPAWGEVNYNIGTTIANVDALLESVGQPSYQADDGYSRDYHPHDYGQIYWGRPMHRPRVIVIRPTWEEMEQEEREATPVQVAPEPAPAPAPPVVTPQPKVEVKTQEIRNVTVVHNTFSSSPGSYTNVWTFLTVLALAGFLLIALLGLLLLIAIVRT